MAFSKSIISQDTGPFGTGFSHFDSTWPRLQLHIKISVGSLETAENGGRLLEGFWDTPSYCMSLTINFEVFFYWDQCNFWCITRWWYSFLLIWKSFFAQNLHNPVRWIRQRIRLDFYRNPIRFDVNSDNRRNPMGIRVVDRHSDP